MLTAAPTQLFLASPTTVPLMLHDSCLSTRPRLRQRLKAPSHPSPFLLSLANATFSTVTRSRKGVLDAEVVAE